MSVTLRQLKERVDKLYENSDTHNLPVLFTDTRSGVGTHVSGIYAETITENTWFDGDYMDYEEGDIIITITGG